MQGNCNFCLTKTKHVVVQFFLGLMMTAFLGLAFGFFVMLLWNWLLPGIWRWPIITYWQAVGLVILARLLLGSHGYNKDKNQEPAGCRINFPPPNPNDITLERDKYCERWWAEEGEASLENYAKRALKNKTSD